MRLFCKFISQRFDLSDILVVHSGLDADDVLCERDILRCGKHLLDLLCHARSPCSVFDDADRSVLISSDEQVIYQFLSEREYIVVVCRRCEYDAVISESIFDRFRPVLSGEVCDTYCDALLFELFSKQIDCFLRVAVNRCVSDEYALCLRCI